MPKHKREIYLHFGDANHFPMLTTRFYGTESELRALVRDAREAGDVVRVDRRHKRMARKKRSYSKARKSYRKR